MPPTLRLGSTAPDFEAETTQGPIKFHEWIGDSWVILFSHPDDFTPVCTTELAEVARREDDFKKRNVKVIGLSANDVASHHKWAVDIKEYGGSEVKYPIIGDHDRKIATLYDMLDYQDATNRDSKGLPLTVRTVFVIDPKKTIRLTLTYPASSGRNFDEIVRVIDSLQLTDKHKVATPVNWNQGDDIVVHVSLSTEEARKTYPNLVEHKPYLRTAQLPV
ncbi:1-Cys peroxiredoxin [Russula dissimulans]|nr:1-Cys peroxiredoxin [Russula dissimulans]